MAETRHNCRFSLKFDPIECIALNYLESNESSGPIIFTQKNDTAATPPNVHAHGEVSQ
jgi:hypothetical protein